MHSEHAPEHLFARHVPALRTVYLRLPGTGNSQALLGGVVAEGAPIQTPTIGHVGPCDSPRGGC